MHWLLNSNRSVVPHSVKPCAWTPTLVVSTTRILIFPQRLPTTFNEVRVMSSSKSVHLTKTTPRRLATPCETPIVGDCRRWCSCALSNLKSPKASPLSLCCRLIRCILKPCLSSLSSKFSHLGSILKFDNGLRPNVYCILLLCVASAIAIFRCSALIYEAWTGHPTVHGV